MCLMTLEVEQTRWTRLYEEASYRIMFLEATGNYLGPRLQPGGQVCV